MHIYTTLKLLTILTWTFIRFSGLSWLTFSFKKKMTKNDKKWQNHWTLCGKWQMNFRNHLSINAQLNWWSWNGEYGYDMKDEWPWKKSVNMEWVGTSKFYLLNFLSNGRWMRSIHQLVVNVFLQHWWDSKELVVLEQGEFEPQWKTVISPLQREHTPTQPSSLVI